MKLLTILLSLTAISLSFSEHIPTNEDENLILTCDNGPCNRPNLQGLECSYSKVNDKYKYICSNQEGKLWRYLNIENPYFDIVKNNFNTYFFGYFLTLGIISVIFLQIKLICKLVSFLIKI